MNRQKTCSVSRTVGVFGSAFSLVGPAHAWLHLRDRHRPLGAVVAGARVTVTNKATNIQQETSTNQTGVYRFVAVEPGIYGVAFSAPGFETLKVEDIQVGTSQDVVVNQAIKLGAEATIIEVTDSPLELNWQRPRPRSRERWMETWPACRGHG